MLASGVMFDLVEYDHFIVVVPDKVDDRLLLRIVDVVVGLGENGPGNSSSLLDDGVVGGSLVGLPVGLLFGQVEIVLGKELGDVVTETDTETPPWFG